MRTILLLLAISSLAGCVPYNEHVAARETYLGGRYSDGSGKIILGGRVEYR